MANANNPNNPSYLNDLEWNYIGEGGKHALFACHRPKFCGKLLRIEKQDFAFSAVWQLNLESSTLRKESDPIFYIKMVVAEKLAPYVDVPEKVNLDWTFLKGLRVATLSSNAVPASRIKDWEPPLIPSSDFVTMTRIPVGLLVIDYRSIPFSLTMKEPRFPTPRRISIELKPKAGYLTFSPLVESKHQIKYRNSRFSLLQRLHQEGHVNKAWTESSAGVDGSYYDPLDLFSTDVARMSRAVENLLECPQNNLRIWYNDHAIVNHTINNSERMQRMKGVAAVLFEDRTTIEDGRNSFESMIVNLVATILSQEVLLPKLLNLQQLDIIDADGAVAIFEHLAKLVGSNDAAEKELRDFSLNDQDEETVHPLFVESPFNMDEKESSSIPTLCETIVHFRGLLEDHAPNFPTDDEIDNFRGRACDIVSRLSVSDCSFLLCNWLLSLAMCDVSIFLTLEQLPFHEISTIHDFGCDTSVKAVVKQDCTEHPGIVDVIVGSERLHFTYNVRVIDCDEKPPEKLRGREKKEELFSKLRMVP